MMTNLALVFIIIDIFYAGWKVHQKDYGWATIFALLAIWLMLGVK